MGLDLTVGYSTPKQPSMCCSSIITCLAFGAPALYTIDYKKPLQLYRLDPKALKNDQTARLSYVGLDADGRPALLSFAL